MYTNVHNRDESHTHTQLPISVYNTHNNNMRYPILLYIVSVLYTHLSGPIISSSSCSSVHLTYYISEILSYPTQLTVLLVYT